MLQMWVQAVGILVGAGRVQCLHCGGSRNNAESLARHIFAGLVRVAKLHSLKPRVKQGCFQVHPFWEH